MAGIYIHIPFCKQACHYCNFHFSTLLHQQADMVNAIQLEIEIKQDFFTDNPQIDTIYFGGGSPSILSTSEISGILEALQRHFNISEHVEVTLEGNPDDLDRTKLCELKLAGITRLSIGIQSFNDDLLTYMNRAHNVKEAHQCLNDSFDLGFDEISIDLIYGIPGLSNDHWEKELLHAAQLSLHHISCYALTVEPSTALHHFILKKNWSSPDEAVTASQFHQASTLLTSLEFDHYEISNFARPGHRAKHNTAYWKGQPYLGLGPSAHSFLPGRRSWNISNNARYIKAIKEGALFSEQEKLSDKEQFNEYIMTGLRTKWGINLSHLRQRFGNEMMEQVLHQVKDLDRKHYKTTEENFVLTKEGWLYSDGIASALFA